VLVGAVLVVLLAAALGASIAGRIADPVARLSRAEAGHFAKSGVEAGAGLWEFRLGESEGEDLAPGSELKVDVFEQGQRVKLERVIWASAAVRPWRRPMA